MLARRLPRDSAPIIGGQESAPQYSHWIRLSSGQVTIIIDMDVLEATRLRFTLVLRFATRHTLVGLLHLLQRREGK